MAASIPLKVDPKSTFDYLLTWKIATQFVNRTDTKEPHENTWNATKKEDRKKVFTKANDLGNWVNEVNEVVTTQFLSKKRT